MRQKYAIWLVILISLLVFIIFETAFITGIIMGIGPYKNKYLSHNIIKCNQTIILKTMTLQNNETLEYDCYVDSHQKLRIVDTSDRNFCLYIGSTMILLLIITISSFICGYITEECY
jgi:hypothetical protein